MLVLHLGHEAGGLEQALAVPTVGVRPVASCHWASAATPAGGRVLGQDVLDVVDQPVVLGVEDLVDGAERDVLVAATVTADEVLVEHLVVVRPGA